MNAESAVWVCRVIAVVALIGFAGFLATPKGRLPLALRGVYRIMRRDCGQVEKAPGEDRGVSAWRRAAAFALVILAIILAVI